ncbi:DUF1659 domain-containing protein [Bacillus salitolerans]|uniref:DUF1659 domain-containing protein n=1 Tax=Bacillus salitolerans TaxID=1437434 RepID=A0ABW4LSX5_9BACI
MAQAIITDSQLRLTFDMGVGEDGKPVFKNKNFNNVKTDSTTDALYAVAQALVGLQQKTLHEIERNDSHFLGE